MAEQKAEKVLTLEQWLKYVNRRCNWVHECRICGANITSGEIYRDGGYGRRAHDTCVDNMREEVSGG